MSEGLIAEVADAIELVTIERQGQGFHLVTGRNDSEAFARAALSVLEPRIEALEREQRWQDIETLKPEFGEVLGYTPGCGYEVVRCHSSGTTYAGAFTADWVKFWRPLPPPPTGERG